MIRFAENLNKMITAGLGGALEAPSTEVAVGHRVRYMDASGAVANFATNVVAPIRSLRVNMQPIQEGSGDPSPDNVRPITGRDSVTVWREASYDPSADPAFTIQLGQTVYGGTVDVVSGKLTVTRKIYKLSELSFSYYSTGGYFRSPQLTTAKKGYNNVVTTMICNMLKGTAPNKIQDLSCNLTTDTNPRIVVRDVSLDGSMENLNNKYADAVFVCEIKEPFDIDITPAQLSTLMGDNNVWSDAGDVTLEYPYYEETEGY